MSKITQTITVGDGSGREGNCLQAAVASLLDLPLNSVPHFLEAPDWEVALAEFVGQHGYRLRESLEVPRLGLAYGPSVRGVTHAVVYRDGQPVWDPHPDRSGLLSVSVFVHFEPVDGVVEQAARIGRFARHIPKAHPSGTLCGWCRTSWPCDWWRGLEELAEAGLLGGGR